MRVLVTGATGFVGRSLCETLSRQGHLVRAALRSDRLLPACITEHVVVGDICATTRWETVLDGVDAIVHLAARAHILDDNPSNEHLYLDVNLHGTECLAKAAARVGVKRFVFLSSVKVNGEGAGARPYTALDVPHPEDAYGKSKWLAEQAVVQVAEQSGMRAAIVRAPLVYGPGVRANFLRLLRCVDRQIPLPLGAIRNRRSLVSVWNLCDLLTNLLKNSTPSGVAWMVSDGADLSTPALIRGLGRAMGRRVRLLPVSPRILYAGGLLVGRKAEVGRLCGSLAVDISSTRERLSWSPPLSVEEGLARTVSWYLSEGRSRGQ